MADGAEGTSPTFIVGMNGSGTTLLLDCLANHPLLYGFPRETRVIPFLLRSAPRYGDLRNDANFRRYWEWVAASTEIRRANGGRALPLPADWRAHRRVAAAPIDAVLLEFARRGGKRRWCEKSPLYGLHIRSLSHFFPTARFVHVIRDGRACAASFHRRWGFHPLHTLYRWKRVVRETRRQGAELARRYHELRYEELVADPERELRKVCRFLAVPFEAAVLVPGRTRPLTVGNRETAVIGADHQAWRGYFSPAQIARMEEIAGALLQELGYPVAQACGDHEPNSLLRRYWLTRDYLYRGLQEASRSLHKGGRGAWFYYFRYLRDALRQRRTSGM